MDTLVQYVFGGFGTVLAGLAVIGVVIGIDKVVSWMQGGGKG